MKLIYLLALPLLAFVADTWQPFAVDSRVSLELPGQPSEVDLVKLTGRSMGHLRYWALRAPEAIYQVMRTPNGGLFLGRADTAGRRQFYRGLISSVLQNEQGQLLSQTPFATAAGTGMEYKYKALRKGTSQRPIKYIRGLVTDSVSYSLLFTPTDQADTLGLAATELRRRFFNSITVKP